MSTTTTGMNPERSPTVCISPEELFHCLGEAGQVTVDLVCLRLVSRQFRDLFARYLAVPREYFYYRIPIGEGKIHEMMIYTINNTNYIGPFSQKATGCLFMLRAAGRHQQLRDAESSMINHWLTRPGLKGLGLPGTYRIGAVELLDRDLTYQIHRFVEVFGEGAINRGTRWILETGYTTDIQLFVRLTRRLFRNRKQQRRVLGMYVYRGFIYHRKSLRGIWEGVIGYLPKGMKHKREIYRIAVRYLCMFGYRV